MSESKVKTKKVTKRKLKLKGVLFLVAFFGILYIGVQLLLQINVKSVIVTGSNFVKDSVIIKDAGLTEDIKYFAFKSESLCDKIKTNPLIKTCKINRQLNFNIEIVIEENIPILYYTSESSVLLSNGNRISSSSNTYGIPTLINFVPEKILLEFLNGLSEVKNDIVRSISEIEYAPTASKDGVFIDEERFMLIMNDGNTVYINNKRLNVLNHYDAVYASIGDKKGIFNFDCDFGNYPFTEYEVTN